MQLLTQPELRTLENRYSQMRPSLMERAGCAAARLALERFGRGHILIFAGPGNNGGDAFVMARELARSGCTVDVIFRGDAKKLPPDARATLQSCQHPRIQLCRDVPSVTFSLVVDGLFGIGLSRPIDGEYADLITRINAFSGPVLALDVPSGLNTDTGSAQGTVVRADLTATFIAAKPGLFTNDGPDHCGEVCVLDLDLPHAQSQGALLVREEFLPALQPRRRNTHKGSFGTLTIVGGSPGMAGAALLAGRAALMLGAGRVMIGMLERAAFDPAQPELMLRSPDEALALSTTAVIGPGLGQSGEALELLRRLASTDFPLLLDADALNLMAAHPVLARHVACRQKPTVLTPHPTEAARLLGVDTTAVQNDRLSATLDLAKRFNACVALKGCGTVLADPTGRWRINPTGNPGLASGGTGDVLAGFTGALMAQQLSAWDALCAAVYLHGAAADALVATGNGPIGMTASELIPSARRIMNRWIVGHV